MKAKIKPVKRIPIQKVGDTNRYPYLSYEGWNDDENTPYEALREFQDDGDPITLIWHTDVKTKIRFDFSTTVLAHCCGIVEMGDIRIDKGMPKDELDKVFNILLEDGKTLVINTIPDTARLPLIEYLKTSKYFTAVKTFKNPRTKNDITIWISNN